MFIGLKERVNVMEFLYTWKNLLASFVRENPTFPQAQILIRIIPEIVTINPKTKILIPNKVWCKIYDRLLPRQYIVPPEMIEPPLNFYSTVRPIKGKHSIAHSNITWIQSEDVRNISQQDALALGFSNKNDCLAAWVWLHDPTMFEFMINADYSPSISNYCPVFLLERPIEYYMAQMCSISLQDIDLNAIRAISKIA